MGNQCLFPSIQQPVFDFYLFFNPVDPFCYSCIDDMIQSIEQLKNKTYLHIIPYQNLQLTKQYMIDNHLPLSNLSVHNKIQETSFNIASTFKAARFQGKKKAHLFLQQLNQFTKVHHHNVSDTMILSAAKQANLDISMLLQDRDSQHVKQLYYHDQRTATQFDIRVTPSVVIFDTWQSSGVLLENDLTLENIFFALSSQMDIAQIK